MARAGSGRAGISVSAILHATESEGVVTAALDRMLGASPDPAARSVLRGHFGNAITVLGATVRDAETALRAVRGALGCKSRADAVAEVRARLHDGTISVRLDKQDLIAGRATLAGEFAPRGGEVVVRIRAPDDRRADVESSLAELLAAPQ